jgi:hypothetical protein
MQIDILLLAEIISALTVISGLIFGIFKFIENNKKQNTEIKKNEQTLTMYALRACLDGLKQQGCNGRVTEAINKIDKYLNQSAHSADDLN